MSVCLDAFAVMTWLQDEPGADEVEKHLRQVHEQEEYRCFLSLINLGEVYYQILRKRGAATADRFWDGVLRGEIPLTVLDVTRKRVLESGRLKARYPIALADAFAIQLALEMRVPLLTGDPEIRIAAKQGLDLQVIWLPKQTV